MLKKCEVLVDRCSLVVGKGSIVFVDDRQFELARNFIRPLEQKSEPVEEAGVEEKPKKKTSKK